jgi:hypothetical protein
MIWILLLSGDALLALPLLYCGYCYCNSTVEFWGMRGMPEHLEYQY